MLIRNRWFIITIDVDGLGAAVCLPTALLLNFERSLGSVCFGYWFLVDLPYPSLLAKLLDFGASPD